MTLFKAALCQLVSLVCVALLGRHLPFRIDIFGLIAAQSILAMSLSRLLRQAFWWLPIHLLFLPSVYWLSFIDVPPWLYLLAFVAMALAFWGTVNGDVPLFLSSPAVTEALAGIVERDKAETLVELGAGVGSVVVPLARRLPALSIVAIERAPLPWLVLRWRCRRLPNVNVRRSSFWGFDLGGYSVAFAFLSPLVMGRLGEKCRREMKSGGLLVSSSFVIPRHRPQATLELVDRRRTRLYCYRFAEN